MIDRLTERLEELNARVAELEQQRAVPGEALPPESPDGERRIAAS